MPIEMPLTFQILNEGRITRNAFLPFTVFRLDQPRDTLSLLDQFGPVVNEYARFIVLDNWVDEAR